MIINKLQGKYDSIYITEERLKQMKKDIQGKSIYFQGHYLGRISNTWIKDKVLHYEIDVQGILV